MTSSHFSSCIFTGVDFSTLESLECVRFENCTFSDCCFSSLSLVSCKFELCSFMVCDFSAAVLANGEITGSRKWMNCFFVGANLSGCSFAGRSFDGSDFSNANLAGCDFENALMPNIRVWTQCNALSTPAFGWSALRFVFHFCSDFFCSFDNDRFHADEWSESG